jgi:hypothetical protein
MRLPTLQASIILIDDRIFEEQERALPSVEQFIDEVVMRYEAPIFGLLLTSSRLRALNLGYIQDNLRSRVELPAALVLPAVQRVKQPSDWVIQFSVGLQRLLAAIRIRVGVRVGIWACVDSGSKMYGQPLELVYWVLLFTGFNPLFMRRVVHFCGSVLECPTYPSALSVVTGRGRDYRDLLLMSLTSIRLGVAHSPYGIAKAIEEALGSNRYGAADSLRKTIAKILRYAESYCLVAPAGGNYTAYAISPFGKLLLDALLTDNLVQYIVPEEAATFIKRVKESGVFE